MESPDPKPSDVIVFDQYQRYDLIRQVLKIAVAGRTKVLEVGGAFSPLRNMVPEHEVVLLDRATNGSLDVRADGLHLPFGNRAFDVVVSTDALEHERPENRLRFVQELQRVTDRMLILGFPQNTPETQNADRAFFDFIRQQTGEDFHYLKEHIQYGLPDTEGTCRTLEASGVEVIRIQNAGIASWLPLQIANFIAENNFGLRDITPVFNELFAKYLNQASHHPPCYRIFLLAMIKPQAPGVVDSLRELSHQKESSVDQYASTSLALASAYGRILEMHEGRFREMEDQIKGLAQDLLNANKSISEQRSLIYDQESIRHELKNENQGLRSRNQNLQDYLNLFLNHPAYKVYKFAKNRIGRLSPSTHRLLDSDIRYELYRQTHEPKKDDLETQRRESLDWVTPPVLNIVTSVFDPPLDIFRETVDSVLNQSYSVWLWNIVDASSGDQMWEYLQNLAAKDSRIRVRRLSENGGISNNTNAAFREATGDFIVMLDHDDTLAPNALFEVASAIRKHPDIDFLYSDADKLDPAGRRCHPLFKPDWSPETMLSYNLLNQLSVFRRSWLEIVGFLNPQLDGAQDWDLYLRITEKTDRIHHIPKVLYHWRITPHSTATSIRRKPYAQAAQITALTNHLERTGFQNPKVFFQAGHPVHKVFPLFKWSLSRNWKISIIIPSRDQARLLSACLKSLFRETSYENYQVILVDTGSTSKQTWRLYEKYKKDPRFRVIQYEGPFNFGKACNLGASHADGDIFLFLNNDTEILQPDWLELMAQWMERKGVGIVGPKLLFPYGKIQHAGVVIGFGGLAGHVFANEAENTASIYGPESWYRNLSAVTAACIMIRRDAYQEVEGFDEGFHLNYSDVDLCLRARAAGYRIVYTPQVRLIHHESATHKRRIPRADFERASQRWKEILQKGDPYFNPNLTYSRALPDYRQGNWDSPMQLHLSLMERLPQKEFILLPDDVL